MKRIGIAAGIVLVLFVALVWYLGQPGKDPLAPRYVTLATQPPGPFGREFFDSGGAVPFAGGKLWITAVPSSTNGHYYRYDLDQRRVVGEILDGWPIFASTEGTKILCGGYNSPATSLRQNIARGLNRLWPGRSRLITMNDVETIWLIDTRDNTAKRLGELHRLPATWGRWYPAPDFRRGYNVPNDSKNSFYLCDLEAGTLEKTTVDGELIGWWDERQIVYQDKGHDFMVFDVVTRKSAPLFGQFEIDRMLETLKMMHPAIGIFARAQWNGSSYDFFFTPSRVNLDSGHSALLKASKAHPRLELISPDFQFGHLGAFDPSGRYYAYNGETGSNGNGSVILRDLKDGTEREIVPTNTLPVYSFPRFYSNSVIYSRNRTLWRVDLDSTNATRLLAVPEK